MCCFGANVQKTTWLNTDSFGSMPIQAKARKQFDERIPRSFTESPYNVKAVAYFRDTNSPIYQIQT